MINDLILRNIKLVQSLNIFVIIVTDLVSKLDKSNDSNATQYENMLSRFLTDEVIKLDKSIEVNL